jgi:putative ABC transport system permease protein
MSVAMSSDLFRIPFVLNLSSYGFAGVVILMASVVSGLIIQQKVKHLNLVSALKVRD